MSTQHYVKQLWQKIRYNSWQRLFHDGLVRLGLRVTPFYLYQQGLFDSSIANLEKGFDEFAVVELKTKDINELTAIPERNFTTEYLQQRLKDGRCYGVRDKGKIVSFTWCNLKECSFVGAQFPLQENEAYLYDFYTLIDYRGKGLAPHILYQVYKILARENRTVLYSISDCNNAQSLRIMDKLKARICAKGLLIDLFKRWRYVHKTDMKRSD